MIRLIFLLTLLGLTGCGSASHWGERPNFNQISMGMNQKQVITILGPPDEIAASNQAVYLNYTFTQWYDHNGADGTAEHYFVRLVDDKVNAFGRKGDFDSVKAKESAVKVEIHNS